MQKRIMMGVALRRVPGLMAAAALLPLAWGCAPARLNPHVEAEVSGAVGLQGVVTFRTEGGPLDEGADGASLSLSEAVERAVMTSAELQAALARVRVAMADSDQARLLPNPVLGVVLRWGAGGSQGRRHWPRTSSGRCRSRVVRARRITDFAGRLPTR